MMTSVKLRKIKCALGAVTVVFVLLLICVMYLSGLSNRHSGYIEEASANKSDCLVLVNRNNPIDPNREVILTELSNGEKVDVRMYPALQKMFDDMRSDGVYPVVSSGYRTEQYQQRLYDDELKSYLDMGYSQTEAETAAERWVAVPGTSEHQLGLAVDINSDGVNSENDEVYRWLARYAHLYGFIYRYQADKVDITGIENEPWHYRYVGTAAAKEIYKNGICLEEYFELIND